MIDAPAPPTPSLDWLIATLPDQLCVAPAQVTPEARLAEDLGADSIDIVEIEILAEDRWGVRLPEGVFEGATTVADLAAALEAKLP